MDAVFPISSKKVWGTRKNDYLLPVKCKISSQSIRMVPPCEMQGLVKDVFL